MAAQATENDSDAASALAVPLCLLHDLLGVAVFLASHPLHAAYLLFFARHLLSLAAFFCPLLVSTALLLAVLVTVGPYVRCGSPEWPPGVRWSLGRTCGIAVTALCAELRPDGGGAGLVGQLCSFILGPGDTAAVVRVGEIVGELCDITGSCFLLEEETSFLFGGDECKELAFEFPLMDGPIGESSFLDHEDFGEIKDEIADKVVISEDLKGSDSLPERCCPSEIMFVQEMEAEGEENGIQEQGLMPLIMSAMDEASDGVEEKRLECDPVSVEMKKSEPVELMEVKKCEPIEAVEIKKREQAGVESMEVKICEPVKPLSSVARRIKLWEAQVSGNVKPVLEDKEDSSVEFSLDSRPVKDAKKVVQLETDPCDDKCNGEQVAHEIASVEQSVDEEEEQGFKDVKECVLRETKTFTEKCSSKDMQAEESPPVAQADQQVQEQGHTNAQPEPELQQHQIGQPEQEVQEREEYEDATESAVMCNERENSLKSMSIAGRVHSRTSSENLVSEGSPPAKEKEWKRTLACKLYEERMQLRLCRDRAVVEGSDNMDMLWEAYEVGGGSNGRVVKRGGRKMKGGGNMVEEFIEEGEEEEEVGDADDEGSVRQLCCLQALKFSTRKMNFGGGRPSLAKISKVLKRMTALSRVGSRRNQKG